VNHRPIAVGILAQVAVGAEVVKRTAGGHGEALHVVVDLDLLPRAGYSLPEDLIVVQGDPVAISQDGAGRHQLPLFQLFEAKTDLPRTLAGATGLAGSLEEREHIGT